MSWEAMGAIGEVMSAVIVAITVIYLAFQTRSTRELVTRATTQTVADAYGRFQSTIVGDSEVADIWNRGMRDLDSLNENERTRFNWLWSMYTNPVRIMWQSGNRQEDVYKTWAAVFESPGARQIFSERSSALPNELVLYLQRFLEKDT